MALLGELRADQRAPDLLARRLGRLDLGPMAFGQGVVRVERQHHARWEMIGAADHHGRAGLDKLDEHRLRIGRAPVVDDENADILDRHSRRLFAGPFDSQLTMRNGKSRPRRRNLDGLTQHETPATLKDAPLARRAEATNSFALTNVVIARPAGPRQSIRDRHGLPRRFSGASQ